MNSEPTLSVNTERLVDLYNRTSKHGQYQLLATPLRNLLPIERLRIQSRHEAERLAFILQNTPWEGASIADIGGNTGYFSLELIARGASNGLYVEGNRDHAEFVREAVRVLGWDKCITVSPQYLDFDEDLSVVHVDICLLLNVLHHVGEDFGNGGGTVEAARKAILEILARLARHARFLALQIGFNWKGNINLPLFRHGTKGEMIDFLREGTKGIWHIRHIGIAERRGGDIVYRELTPTNILRDDSLGEFLNRPLFIMEACES